MQTYKVEDVIVVYYNGFKIKKYNFKRQNTIIVKKHKMRGIDYLLYLQITANRIFRTFGTLKYLYRAGVIALMPTKSCLLWYLLMGMAKKTWEIESVL
jgi:hypothetical protein